MLRRPLLATCMVLLAAPVTAFSQATGKVWRVGFLNPARPVDLATDPFGEFVRGMSDLGYVEGKNLVIEWRSADGRYERLPDLAAELVHLKVDVMVTASTPGTGAAQKATSTIPIVMTAVADPVGSGFVKSLGRPGGNITGLSNLVGDFIPKQLELLLGTVPKLSKVAVLLNPDNPTHLVSSNKIQTAAGRTGSSILPLAARNPQEIEAAFSTMAQQKAGAVIVLSDTFLIQQRHQIADLATKFRLPTMQTFRENVTAGGLMSYGPSRDEIYRRAASYVDKILKGAKAGELPVEQPTKLELVINQKTAKALGITIPQSLLLRADEVIQ